MDPRTHVTALRGALVAGAIVVAIVLLSHATVTVRAQAPDPCAPPNGNPVVCENQQARQPRRASGTSTAPATPRSRDSRPTSASTAAQTVGFKIDTDARRLPARHLPNGLLRRPGRAEGRARSAAGDASAEPAELPERRATGLIDCGNWAQSASWAVPPTAVSGIYFAKLTRTDTGGASHIVFIVRDDAAHSDLLFQTSDTTWQAYNQYGGNSLYVGSPAGRAYKVSYNRPFTTPRTGAEDWVFNAEYPMVRWLEATATTSATSPASTPTAAAPNCSSTRSSCRSATTSTGRAASAPTSRRRATPA